MIRPLYDFQMFLIFKILRVHRNSLQSRELSECSARQVGEIEGDSPRGNCVRKIEKQNINKADVPINRSYSVVMRLIHRFLKHFSS
jgi:hypothetical protein